MSPNVKSVHFWLFWGGGGWVPLQFSEWAILLPSYPLTNINPHINMIKYISNPFQDNLYYRVHKEMSAESAA